MLERGHKVVVLTNTYNQERSGVRYLTNGIKVYYSLTPTIPKTQGSILQPYFVLSVLRNIIEREQINIIHGHQGASCLNLQVLQYAPSLGVRTVFTDHSLFGFDDAACIHLNKVLKWIMTEVDGFVVVSNANKENLVLRARINP